MTLQYSPRMSSDRIDALESAAARVGLGLEHLELLGQSPGLAQAFVDSVEDGYHDDFLDVVAWDSLRRRRRSRRERVRAAHDQLVGETAPIDP